ncbi:MAG: ATP-binding protein, partial [Dehalococcoidia bacterium]
PGLLTLADGARLRRAEFVEVHGDGPWATRPVQVVPRVLWALAGDASPDPALPRRAEVMDAADRRGEPPEPLVLLVHGGDRATRRIEAGRRTSLALLASPLPADDDAWRALVREATILGAGVLIEVEEPRLTAVAAHWIDRADHLAWVLASRTPIEIRTLPSRPWQEQALDVRMATTEEWAEAFGRRPDRGHRLDPEGLRLAQVAYQGLGDLDGAVRRLASGALDELAVRIPSRRTWENLVLPHGQERQLRELVARYKHSATVYDRWGFSGYSGTGLVALFAGPSGTGKTLAAEVVGSALGLDAYKIDLSSLVSKYIGETEKNLERIFEAASAGNVVLFFDEADALFGKRSEVGDSHDRYANIEVAYLLQRIEAYEGIVVLATNLRANMDDAFLRRIHVAVDFREPDEAQRLQIWRLSFPEQAPQEDLDLPWLAARFRVTGGNIRNAATTAAFLAADAGRAITMEDVVRGLDREYEKL